ncbi:MAG: hypothetical protein V4550_14665 [Gemmatimonadota bacterium]
MILALLLLLQQTPDAQYAGHASSKTAGETTALAGHLFRFLFTTVPQWVQLGGIFIGVPVAAIVAWHMWKRRRELWAWWLSRSLFAKSAMAATILTVGVVGIGSGLYGYNYMMHENDFCQSCHVMDTAWNRFQVSAHKDVTCHGCHRQPMYVSSVELFWWVTERRMTIPPHDKVPSKVCGECHMRAGTDSARTLVTLTAGHALHLRSTNDSLSKIQCTSCHGRDFHQFTPTAFSCTQSGCHFNQRVNLGDMSKQGFMHCTSCHDFKGLVPPGTTVAQAKLALVPKVLDCTSCHPMTKAIKNFDLALDPHKGNCGSCHDVHKNTEPKDAFKTCATAQCHASADTLTAFHRGLGKHSLDQCGACHQAHSWKVKGTDCKACHTTINQDRPKARRVSEVPRARAPRRLARHTRATRGVIRFASLVTREAPVTPARDTGFLHSRHSTVGCTQCHAVNSTHGGLTFSRPAGCTACHHGAQQKATCTACHAAGSLPQRDMPMAFAISARKDPVTRQIGFTHTRHDTLACVRCHANAGNRKVTTTCASCHTSHHTAVADCASCHTTARVGHDRASHAGCASCHTDATIAALPLSRAICVTCHQPQRTHYPQGDCAACHALDHGMLSARRPEIAK